MTRYNQHDVFPDERVAVIPTPEEEAIESAHQRSNVASNNAMLAILVMVGIAVFHNEIVALIGGLFG